MADNLAQMTAKCDVKGLIRLLGSTNQFDMKQQQPIRDALVSIGADAIAPLIAALQDQKLQFGVGFTLVSIGAAAVEPLIAALAKSGNPVRVQIAMVFEMLKDPRAFQPLLNLLAESDPLVSAGAARALGAYKDPRAVEPLMVRLSTANSILDNVPRAAAAEALGKIGDARALDALTQALQDRDPQLRQTAEKAIRAIKG